MRPRLLVANSSAPLQLQVHCSPSTTQYFIASAAADVLFILETISVWGPQLLWPSRLPTPCSMHSLGRAEVHERLFAATVCTPTRLRLCHWAVSAAH